MQRCGIGVTLCVIKNRFMHYLHSLCCITVLTNCKRHCQSLQIFLQLIPLYHLPSPLYHLPSPLPPLLPQWLSTLGPALSQYGHYSKEEGRVRRYTLDLCYFVGGGGIFYSFHL